MTAILPYIYRWDRQGRKGQPCEVLVRAKAENDALRSELANARNLALEEAAEVADAAMEMRERLFRENGASINAAKAIQAERIAADIRRLKAEGESR